MLKRSALCLGLIACLALGLLTASAAAKGAAATEVTLRLYPDGLYGFVSSPAAKDCAADRRVVIFEQEGESRDPGSDRKVATTRSGDAEEGYQWSTRAGASGRFYAQAPRRKGCRAALSKTFATAPMESLLGGRSYERSYPPCGPYLNEGSGEICRLETIHYYLRPEGFLRSCSIGKDNGNCEAVAQSGPFPWGTSYVGGGTDAQVFWNGGSRKNLTFVTYRKDQGRTGTAHLGGIVPFADSPSFTVTDGFAQNDQGYPNGLHFYTPDLPGQEPGEVGGPLYLNFINSGADSHGDAYLSGYLYLKR